MLDMELGLNSAVGIGRDEDQTLKRVKKSSNMKKRYRGKRKPKRKENRRRVRPGKSRNGFPTMGAPFNNNEFLINQMMDGKQTGNMDSHDLKDDPTHIHHHHHHHHHHREKDNIITTSLKEMANFCGTTDCKQHHEDSSPCSTSSKSAETSDYDSLHSPTESSSVCSDGGEYISDDESFDADFAMRNFEAEYSAHQHEMKEQLTKLPRQQLEIRCSLLMDQLKDLEEKRQIMTGRSRVEELEMELELLRKENRQLRGDTAD